MKHYTYLIAVDLPSPPKEFTDFLEKFSPRFSLRQGVHVCHHATELSISELSQYVGEVLPKGVAYFVAISQEHLFVPNPAKLPKNQSSAPE